MIMGETQEPNRCTKMRITIDQWEIIIGCEECKGNTDGEMNDQVCSKCGIEYGDGMIEIKNK